ncbi:uncharacterized protein N7477_008792 [Penicillium maclennaniae]|uniref:uncharacterized protein n=1 Tax=Penicillium maclennaniae TaxID=1343394 RepID=UPI00253FA156|nr:uncharacterized protein N7477_008792 [Penicillium maclennaniae]KAJ5666344.1 hypothetical protein N7477_008792 [Penicillium maclennaniae]
MNQPPPDSARRASQGSSGSPGHGSHENSAPPSFGTRQMPPPSPPYSYGSRSQSANAPTNSFLSRDAPHSQAQRPGSSIYGAAPFSRPSATSQFGGAPTPASAAMSPPTAPARPSSFDQSNLRRSHTPEKSFSRSQQGRPYRSGSGGGSSLLSGEQNRYGGFSHAPQSQFPEKPHSTHPSPQITAAEPPNSEPRRMSFSGPIARPSSQPPNAEASTRPSGYSPLSRPNAGVADRSEPGRRASPASYAGLDPHGRDPHGRFGSLFGDRRSEDVSQRDRERASHGAEPKGSFASSARYGSSIYGKREALERQPTVSTWEQGRSHPPSPESKRFPAPEAGAGFGFGAIQSYTKSLGSQPGGSRQPPLSLQTGQSQPSSSPRESLYSNKQPQPPRLGSNPNSASSSGPNTIGLGALGEEGRRKGSEELLQHRNLLSLGADVKRGGRASPLPQAVQGAQAPFINPSGEPGIKNELGRVFSGIGSGVGGVGGMTGASVGSGPSTPLIASPFKRDSFNSRPVNGEADDKTARPTSASGTRRARKSRDDDAQMELDGSEVSGRAARRSRHTHPHHHHHHHHHHRHKAEEEAAVLTGLHRSLSSVNPFNRTSTPADVVAGHHHHHHHHHHHAPRPVAAASPIREPRTTVNLEPLLASVSHLPRQHLGSTLYNPRIGVPSAKSSAESSKFGYTSTPRPLPRFEKRENCTFTVRVPRFRIDSTHREEICARRALWGTGVYTDDSDPVAAAIHSGYIRGAWGEDVDESMLDLEIKDIYQHAPQSTANKPADGKSDSHEKEARLPPVPPPDQDLHITLLILPRLEKYDSTVMFGLKSRKFEGRHDGMSFMVHSVDWVDDGVGRGEERSGEARRKRLRTLMQTGRICTGPAMAKMDELRRSGVQVPRTIDGQEQPTHVQPVS